MNGRVKQAVQRIIRRSKYWFKRLFYPREVLRKEQAILRLGLVISQLRPLQGRPHAKLVKVNSIADVTRFMLILCDVESLKMKTVGGLVRCNVKLPHHAGDLTLRERKTDDSHRTLAVLKLNIPQLNPQVDKIVFKKRNNNQKP